jgi:cell division protein FtsL
MSDLELEYAIRQDVKNNPIVREVDRARVWEMWRWGAVLVGLGAVLLFSAWQHFQVLRNGYVLEDMRKQRVAEEEVRRHLLLERAVLLAPQRIEGIATHQLHLVAPGPDQTIVIERVVTNTPPARGVVASR